jgi:hypothetical protein
MPQQHPEIEFVAYANGMMIKCKRFKTPRYITWDLPGRCSRCKSSEVDIDYVLQPNGVTIKCNRLNSQIYLAFDEGARWTDGTQICLRSRTKVLNMPLMLDGMQQQQQEQGSILY